LLAMCVGLCCDCLYRSRCLFWKLLPILWIVDMALTIYLIVNLYQSDIFACCTTNMDGIGEICGYDDLGGASNIFVNDYGYCGRRDTNKICYEIGECAELQSTATSIDQCTSMGIDNCIVPRSNATSTAQYESFGNTLCTQTVLDDVAFYNYFWLNGVLITKCVGLLFLILLDLRACLNKIDPDEQEAQQTETCFKCKKWGKDCCVKTIVLILKATFLIFGTFATFAALYYMQLTGHVWTSSCSAVPDSLQTQCQQTESVCNNGDNYYAVVFDSLDLGAPYFVDIVSNVLHTVLWIVRIAVMRYALKATHLASV